MASLPSPSRLQVSSSPVVPDAGCRRDMVYVQGILLRLLPVPGVDHGRCRSSACNKVHDVYTMRCPNEGCGLLHPLQMAMGEAEIGKLQLVVRDMILAPSHKTERLTVVHYNYEAKQVAGTGRKDLVHGPHSWCPYSRRSSSTEGRVARLQEGG